MSDQSVLRITRVKYSAGFLSFASSCKHITDLSWLMRGPCFFWWGFRTSSSYSKVQTSVGTPFVHKHDMRNPSIAVSPAPPPSFLWQDRLMLFVYSSRGVLWRVRCPHRQRAHPGTPRIALPVRLLWGLFLVPSERIYHGIFVGHVLTTRDTIQFAIKFGKGMTGLGNLSQKIWSLVP